MTSPGAGQPPLRSRWSDSTLSTTFDVHGSTPTSPAPTMSKLPTRNDSARGRPAPSPIHEDSAAEFPQTQKPTQAQDSAGLGGPHGLHFSQPPPLRKSTTSSSARSGEITIMLDTDLSSLPRPRSTPQPSRDPLRLDPPILQLPSDQDAGSAPLPREGLKSRYFQRDRTVSTALRSPSSLVAPPSLLPRQPSPSTPMSRHFRTRSDVAAVPFAADFLTPSPPPSTAAMRPQTLHAPVAKGLRSQAPVRALSATFSTRGNPEASDMPAMASTLRPRGSSPAIVRYEAAQTPSASLGVESHYASPASDVGADARRLTAVSALSSVSGPSQREHASSIPLAQLSSLSPPPLVSPAVSTFSRGPRHARNLSSVSAVSEFNTSRASDAARSARSSRTVTKGRLKSALPPIPPPFSPADVGNGRYSTISSTSKGSSVLDRIGTLTRLGRKGPSSYQKLDDSQEGDEASSGHAAPSFVSSQPYEMPLGVDISSFTGLQDDQARMGTQGIPQRKQTIRSRTSEDDMLESKGQLTGALGMGMTRVVTKRLQYPDSHRVYGKSQVQNRWRRDGSGHPGQRLLAQQTAVYEGTVIAVDEDVTVDLSNVEGPHGAAGLHTELDLIVEAAVKQSYYFPPDTEMPNWRPVTMRAWYILCLIILAVAFVVVIEILCHLSNRSEALMMFIDPDTVSTGDWFVWKYLPEAIFVTYGVLFQATDFEVRRLEPYYQMSQPTGAKAEEALNMDYLTFWSYLIPFKAFRHRQWAVMQSSIATILTSAVIPVLFSAALNMDPDRDQRTVNKPKYVRMDPVWSRIMEAALIIVAILSILLLLQLRRKSGLVSNPKGIAGIATMATKSHILNDFRGLDMASHRTIHKHLAHRRYILHKTSLWQGEYITRADTTALEAKKPQNPHPMALQLYFGLPFIAFLIFFLVFIPVVEFQKAVNIVTDKAPWFLTLLATLIKLSWTNLETGVRMIQPFYVLSRRHAAPRILLLDYTGTIPGYMPIKAIVNKHFLLAAVGLGSVMCEVLTVVVSSFNIDGRYAIRGKGAGGETQKTYVVSFAIAEAIPVLLIIILAGVYLRRRHAFLPRQPGTIASVLAFLAQSKMLYDFAAHNEDEETKRGEDLSSIQREPGFFAAFTGSKALPRDSELDVAQQTVLRLEQRGKTFGLGWYRGRDGTDHLGIDEEELLADYRHGIDWSKGRMGVGDIGRWENL